MFDRIRFLPGLRQLYAMRVRRGFEGDWAGTCLGVFETFEEAIRSAPKTKQIGYDHPGPASLYEERLRTVVASDYPVLFWLDRLVREGAHFVFDFGGHVGLAFHAYRRYIEYPSGFRWLVYDVPAVRERGAQLARERGTGEIEFTDNTRAASGADVLLAAGSLQYVDEPAFSDYLLSLPDRPKHILLSKLPLAPEAFITLQNIGTAYCPYRIFGDKEFVKSLEDIGYRLVDRWSNAEKCVLPLTPERNVDSYSGLYFRLE